MAAKPGTSPGVRAGEADVHTFRSPTALVVWVVWLLFAVGNWIDIAVQGRDHLSVVAAAILLLATGAIYTCAQRPRVIADTGGVTIRNPLRDHRIGWAAISDVDLVDLLRVHCDWAPPGTPAVARKDRRVISCWAVHYSRRRQFTAEAKARRAANRSRHSPLSLAVPSYGSRGLSASSQNAAPEAEAERVARLLREHATAARAHPTPAPSATPAPAEPPRSTWNRTALAAIGVPLLILLIVCLI